MLSYEQIAELKSRLERENAYLIEEIKSEHNFEEMVGASPGISEPDRQGPPGGAHRRHGADNGRIRHRQGVGSARHPLAQRARHEAAGEVNCAAISAGLVESELFGHVEALLPAHWIAASAGLVCPGGHAIPRRSGRTAARDSGQTASGAAGARVRAGRKQSDRAGGCPDHRRHKSPAGDGSKEGKFRADLDFRLNVVPIELPPLRERKSDIPDLVSFILAHHNRQFGPGRIEIGCG